MVNMITLQVKNDDLRTAVVHADSHSDAVMAWADKSLREYIRFVYTGIPTGEVIYCGPVSYTKSHVYCMEYVPITANFIVQKDD